MAEGYNFLPKINRNDLLKAKDYLWAFLPLFITDEMRNNHREIRPKLNSSQQTFLTFYLLEKSMCNRFSDDYAFRINEGSFLQLIYDGYGKYVFETSFSKIIKKWGAMNISRIVESAKSIYEKHKDKVKKVKTEKELSDLCAEITDFEILDEEYKMISIEEIKKIKEHIENNISEFAIIDENNTQVSHVVRFLDIDVRKRIIEEGAIIGKYHDKIDELSKDGEDSILIMNESDYNKLTLTNRIIRIMNGKGVTIKFQKDVR
jgi:hypothetical protein